MITSSWIVLGLAYVVGLLLTVIPLNLTFVLLTAGIWLTLTIAVPYLWRTGPHRRTWAIAGLVTCIAVGYFHLRLPQAGTNDISTLVNDQPVAIEVWGQIASPPRLTRSQRIQFELAARQVRLAEPGAVPKSIAGAVYATVPILQGTGLSPGQTVTVGGTLYRPKAAANPGGFDFSAYLQQQGIFAGISGRWVSLPGEDQSLSDRSISMSPGQHLQRGLWQIRQRIVRSQVVGLGVPEGPLLSAMVMGKASVDVPYDVQDTFIRVGLAAALAASGFQVSLLIAVMLKLTDRLSRRMQAACCMTVLLFYLGLTGLEPSVFRAGVMGGATLLALLLERQVKPLGSLLLAAVLLLLFDPRWIWDLGFHLSFWATLALLVTAPQLDKRLDWLPNTIATAFSVPIAAFLWTLPLQLFAFGVLSPYSIPVNILLSPLITAISIGGMAASPIALIFPAAGSFLAGLLYLPTHWLIDIAEAVSHLPGNAIAVGTLSVAQLIALYGLYGLIWWSSSVQRYDWLVGIICVGIVALPTWQQYSNLVQATVLATTQEPIMVVQQRGAIGVIGGSDGKDTHFNLLPFLQKQGVNQIDWAIAPVFTTGTSAGWLRLIQAVPLRTFYSDPAIERSFERSLPPNLDASTRESLHSNRLNYQALMYRLRTGRTALLPLSLEQDSSDSHLPNSEVHANLLQSNVGAIYMMVEDQPWLFLDRVSPQAQTQLIKQRSLSPIANLWWTGEELNPQLLDVIQPQVAIASARTIPAATASWLNRHHVTTYVTAEDGAIQWTPKSGFRSQLQQFSF